MGRNTKFKDKFIAIFNIKANKSKYIKYVYQDRVFILEYYKGNLYYSDKLNLTNIIKCLNTNHYTIWEQLKNGSKIEIMGMSGGILPGIFVNKKQLFDKLKSAVTYWIEVIN